MTRRRELPSERSGAHAVHIPVLKELAKGALLFRMQFLQHVKRHEALMAAAKRDEEAAAAASLPAWLIPTPAPDATPGTGTSDGLRITQSLAHC